MVSGKGRAEQYVCGQWIYRYSSDKNHAQSHCKIAMALSRIWHLRHVSLLGSQWGASSLDGPAHCKLPAQQNRLA